MSRASMAAAATALLLLLLAGGAAWRGEPAKERGWREARKVPAWPRGEAALECNASAAWAGTLAAPAEGLAAPPRAYAVRAEAAEGCAETGRALELRIEEAGGAAYAGDTFRCRAAGPAVVRVAVRDRGDGRYDARVTLPVAGEYRVECVWEFEACSASADFPRPVGVPLEPLPVCARGDPALPGPGAPLCAGARPGEADAEDGVWVSCDAAHAACDAPGAEGRLPVWRPAAVRGARQRYAWVPLRCRMRHYSAAEARRCLGPGGALFAGTSRERTMFHDAVELLGGAEPGAGLAAAESWGALRHGRFQCQWPGATHGVRLPPDAPLPCRYGGGWAPADAEPTALGQFRAAAAAASFGGLLVLNTGVFDALYFRHEDFGANVRALFDEVDARWNGTVVYKTAEPLATLLRRDKGTLPPEAPYHQRRYNERVRRLQRVAVAEARARGYLVYDAYRVARDRWDATSDAAHYYFPWSDKVHSSGNFVAKTSLQVLLNRVCNPS